MKCLIITDAQCKHEDTDKKRSHNLAPEKCPIFETLQVTNLAYVETEVI